MSKKQGCARHVCVVVLKQRVVEGVLGMGGRGCFRHGRPGGEGSGLAAGFVGKVLVMLGG